MILFLCSMLFADEVITLKKGESAPFDGTLLSPEAAAKLLASSESDLSKCKADLEIQKLQFENKLDLETGLLTVEIDTCKLERDRQKKIYEEHIKLLEQRSKPSWHDNLLFAGGVATGVAVVVLSAWTLDKIQVNQ